MRYAEAVQLKAAAKAELENAQLLAEAIQSRADWEVALEEAGTALRVYEDRNSLLNQYRSEKDEALESLEKAQRKLADLLEAEAETGGLQSHIRGQKELLKLVQESYEMAQEKVAAAEQLDADMTLAKASLNSAKDELERLEQEAIAYLTEIGFGVEYGSSSTVLHKWTTDVNLRMYGSPTPTDVATLTQVVTELNELIRGIELTLNDGPADVEVHFVPESQFQSIEPHYQPVNYGFFRVWWDHGGAIYRGRILVASEGITQQERSHLIREEITQSLGLFRDSWRYPDSIFYQGWTATGEYASIDGPTIRLLYQPQLLPGMTKLEVRDLLSLD